MFNGFDDGEALVLNFATMADSTSMHSLPIQG